MSSQADTTKSVHFTNKPIKALIKENNANSSVVNVSQGIQNQSSPGIPGQNTSNATYHVSAAFNSTVTLSNASNSTNTSTTPVMNQTNSTTNTSKSSARKSPISVINQALSNMENLGFGFNPNQGHH